MILISLVRLVKFFNQESTQAFLAASDNFAMLAFRGAECDQLTDVSWHKLVGRTKYAATLPWLRPGAVWSRPFADHASVNYTAAFYQNAAT